MSSNYPHIQTETLNLQSQRHHLCPLFRYQTYNQLPLRTRRVLRTPDERDQVRYFRWNWSLYMIWWPAMRRSVTMKRSLPVKHSTNLKPSVVAIASIILELTVEATIASRSRKKSRCMGDLDHYTRPHTQWFPRRLITIEDWASKKHAKLIAGKVDPSSIPPVLMFKNQRLSNYDHVERATCVLQQRNDQNLDLVPGRTERQLYLLFL